MLKKDIKKGILVRPSKSKMSKTRFWQLSDYKGEVVGFYNSVYVEVNWSGLLMNGEWKPITHKSLHKPIDLQPYDEAKIS